MSERSRRPASHTSSTASSNGRTTSGEPVAIVDSLPRLPRGGPLEGGEQGLGVGVVPHAVDVEGRRAVHAAPNAAQEVLVDPRGVNVLGKIPVESLDVEGELLGVRM